MRLCDFTSARNCPDIKRATGVPMMTCGSERWVSIRGLIRQFLPDRFAVILTGADALTGSDDIFLQI